MTEVEVDISKMKRNGGSGGTSKHEYTEVGPRQVKHGDVTRIVGLVEDALRVEERRPAGRARGYYGPRTYDEVATVVNNGFYASPELFERIVDVADANTANHGLAMSSSSSAMSAAASSSSGSSTRRYRSGPKNGLFKLTLVSKVAKDAKERKAVVQKVGVHASCLTPIKRAVDHATCCS